MGNTENTITVWSAIVSSWERPGSQHYPKGLLQNESNANALQFYLKDAITKGVEPTMENWKALVQQATTDGRLQFDTPPVATITQVVAPVPPPFNPSEHLPFSEIKELKFLDSLEALQKFEARIGKDGLNYLSGFRRLRPNSTKDYEELDARMNYIRQHQIYKPQTVEQPSTKPRVIIPPLIAQSRDLVERMNPGDIGTTGSSMGRHQILLNKKRKIHESINEDWSKGVRHEVILQRTKQAIADAGSSSVR